MRLTGATLAPHDPLQHHNLEAPPIPPLVAMPPDIVAKCANKGLGIRRYSHHPNAKNQKQAQPSSSYTHRQTAPAPSLSLLQRNASPGLRRSRDQSLPGLGNPFLSRGHTPSCRPCGTRRDMGLHLTAGFGLPYLSEKLLSEIGGNTDVSADSKDGKGRTPLSWAAEGGHEAVVKLLAERDDVAADSKDKWGRMPLW